MTQPTQSLPDRPIATAPVTTGTGNGNVDWTASTWRFVRGFVGTIVSIFVASVVTALLGLQTVPINFSNPQQTAKALLLAFIIGFLNSAAKTLRDKFPDTTTKTGLVLNNLPL